MKTTDLIELQKTITQGDWQILPNGDVCTELKTEIDFGGTTGKRPVQLIVGKVNNYTMRAPEPTANARAIALTPKLIAEVIKLRSALSDINDLARKSDTVGHVAIHPELKRSFIEWSTFNDC